MNSNEVLAKYTASVDIYDTEEVLLLESEVLIFDEVSSYNHSA